MSLGPHNAWRWRARRRLYQDDNGSLERVTAPADAPAANAAAPAWGLALAPSLSTAERHAALSELLGLPAEGRSQSQEGMNKVSLCSTNTP